MAKAGPEVVRVTLAAEDGPSIGCAVNGANYSRDAFIGPNQLLTLFGANIPSGAKIIFNGNVEAPLLYSSPTQMNAVTPPEVAQGGEARMELDVNGVRSNGRIFLVRNPNPTVKLHVTADGKVIDHGNQLADTRLSNGSPNADDNPASYGETVTIYTTGVDLGLPIDVTLNGNHADLVDAFVHPGSFNAVTGLKVRVPNVCCGGVEVITIKNGSNDTVPNAGYVWVR